MLNIRVGPTDDDIIHRQLLTVIVYWALDHPNIVILKVPDQSVKKKFVAA